MSITIIVAIVLSFVALALFVRARGLSDKVRADHDPAHGSPARNNSLAIAAAVAAAIAWAIAFILGRI